MRIILTLSLIVALKLNTLYSQSIKSPKLWEMEHITIDSLIYYENPYTIKYNKAENLGFIPDWHWANCATSYPPAFTNYKEDALQYFDATNTKTKKELKAFQKKWRKVDTIDYRLPYEYILGEIRFTNKYDKKQYLFTLSFAVKNELKDLDFKNIDPEVSRQIKRKPYNEVDTTRLYFPIYYNSVGRRTYILEDGIYKHTDGAYVTKQIINKGDAKIFTIGYNYPDFRDMLNSVPTYTKVTLKNSERVISVIQNKPSLSALPYPQLFDSLQSAYIEQSLFKKIHYQYQHIQNRDLDVKAAELFCAEFQRIGTLTNDQENQLKYIQIEERKERAKLFKSARYRQEKSKEVRTTAVNNIRTKYDAEYVKIVGKNQYETFSRNQASVNREYRVLYYKVEELKKLTLKENLAIIKDKEEERKQTKEDSYLYNRYTDRSKDSTAVHAYIKEVKRITNISAADEHLLSKLLIQNRIDKSNINKKDISKNNKKKEFSRITSRFNINVSAIIGVDAYDEIKSRSTNASLRYQTLNEEMRMLKIYTRIYKK